MQDIRILADGACGLGGGIGDECTEGGNIRPYGLVVTEGNIRIAVTLESVGVYETVLTLAANMDLPKLEAIVGHVDRETTKIYTHLKAADLVQAVQGMDSKTIAVCNKSATRSTG